MRRADREIKDINELKEIVHQADVCRIGFAVDNRPYIVPMNYGYKWEGNQLILYFHCAGEGKKMELMKKNNIVCFEMDIDRELIRDNISCKWGMRYRSIIGLGALNEVMDLEEKEFALNNIMSHYGFVGKSDYDEKILNKTKILRLNVTEITGKKQG